MTLGNEYGGKDDVLSRWVQMLIDEDPRQLYSRPRPRSPRPTASSPKARPAAAFTAPARRTTCGGHGRQGGRAARRRTRSASGLFFPNFDEMKKYDGVFRRENFAIVRDDLKRQGMLDQAPRFRPGHRQPQAVLLYKEEIELLLRTPGYAGFSLLDLHDYPSQGTALVGIARSVLG